MAMLPGVIAFHLPSNAKRPPAVLEDEMRLVQDLGLDSLALTEMAFMLSEFLGLSIETREMAGVVTVGDLRTLLEGRLATR